MASDRMEFKEPFKIYTAENNLEAQMIVQMLGANGIAAFADEDQSGVSLWAFGTITQFHQPNVWIEKSATQSAAELIRRFEETKRVRENPGTGNSQIQVECEECGKISSFPDSLDGTTQECSHCQAYLDVGEVECDGAAGESEE